MGPIQRVWPQRYEVESAVRLAPGDGTASPGRPAQILADVPKRSR